jgi:Uma2 family endonuclease
MTMLSGRLPMVAPAARVPGPKQGRWTYTDYAALPDDGQRYEIVKGNHIVGAPDLVIEVTSPGSATYDRHNKYAAYARAGVPEYWIADPWTRTVEVFWLGAGEYQSQGVFRGQATLPAQVVPSLPVQGAQFFASVWEAPLQH